MALAEFEKQERRLVILRLLAEDSDYRAPSSIIESGLKMYALETSRDNLHTELHWLQEQSLLALEEVSTIFVATLTQRGLDVSKGLATVPGVKRPGPGA